ncbi:adenosine kinase [Streptomyces gulbargensis]|uniref:Adenosine kinase n=1 Tax=Streptomyces gulbargensis TaxID=364901 RepID=A0ABP7L7Q4_9ACTN
MNATYDVLVLGGAGVDTIVYVPELPLPWADSHLVERGIEARAGQTGDFVALGLSALGLRTHHLDLVGDDPFGDLVRAFHRDRGLPFTGVPATAGTKRAVNLVGPDGRRLSLYDGSRAAAEDRLPAGLVGSLASASRHAHVSITHGCAEALPVLRAAGVTISTDLHDWDGENPHHEPFAYGADVVFVSCAALGDPERTMRRVMERGRAEAVVATAGAEGAYLLTAEGLTRVPAVAPAGPVVDSNGAGDAFAAGFLFGRLSGEDPPRCALYGAVAGAYACTVPATRAAAIDRAGLLREAARLTASGADGAPAPGAGRVSPPGP